MLRPIRKQAPILNGVETCACSSLKHMDVQECRQAGMQARMRMRAHANRQTGRGTGRGTGTERVTRAQVSFVIFSRLMGSEVGSVKAFSVTVAPNAPHATTPSHPHLHTRSHPIRQTVSDCLRFRLHDLRTPCTQKPTAGHPIRQML